MKDKKMDVSPRKKPRQERSKETVQIILKAATHIIEKYGVEKASTNKIAEKAGVSIGSLYQYFPGKEAIMGKLFESYMNNQIKQIDKAFKDNKVESLLDAIKLILQVVISDKKNNVRLNKMMFENLIKLSRVQLVQNIQKEYIKVFKEKSAPFKHEIRKGDLDLIFFNIIQSITMISIATLYSDEYELDDPRVYDEIVELCYRYLKK